MNTRTKTVLTTGSLGLLLAGTGAGVATAATPAIAAPTGSASATTSAPAPAATPVASPAATPAKDSPAATPAVAPAPTPAVTPSVATTTPAATPSAATTTPGAPSQGQDSQGQDFQGRDFQGRDFQGRDFQGQGKMKGLKHGEFTVHTKTGDKVVDIQGGQVSAVEAGSVTVKSIDGFTATYTLDPTTKVERNEEATTSAQITTNDQVRVVVDKSGTGNNAAIAIATAIHIGDSETAK